MRINSIKNFFATFYMPQMREKNLLAQYLEYLEHWKTKYFTKMFYQFYQSLITDSNFFLTCCSTQGFRVMESYILCIFTTIIMILTKIILNKALKRYNFDITNGFAWVR